MIQFLLFISVVKLASTSTCTYFAGITIKECAAMCNADNSCVGGNFDSAMSICQLASTNTRVEKNNTDLVTLVKVSAADVSRSDCSSLNEYSNGVNTIFGGGCTRFDVWCDIQTDNGGWTVIQRRESGDVNFDRSWIEYEDGFGYINSEFWLGNTYLHLLTSQADYELRIDLEDFENQHTLQCDSFGSSNSYPFTSKDQDNDNWAANCGFHWVAWWHDACPDGNLNGRYYQNGSNTDVTGGLVWKTFYKLYSLRKTVMMIRRI